ncbi:zinc finger protein 800a isoform X2 [Polypterus senegalus]|nr:zinc finger protein 800a isoform X2 [Polypterus senegalus]
MERSHFTYRKTSRYLRKQHHPLSKNDPDLEENKLRTQRTPLKDKCCQTDHHHHGCCEPAYVVEPGDPPLLQKQLQTSKSGIQQIIECFRSGTSQLKNILLKEVDTIFECKLCRSLFRGLPNLITHKEFYCFPKITDPPVSNDKQSQAIRDLLDAIYPRKDQQEFVVRLEPIETNRNAVYQFVTKDDDNEQQLEKCVQNVVELREDEPALEINQIQLPPDVEIVEPVAVEDVPEEEEIILGDDATETELSPDETSNCDGTGPHVPCCICGKDFNSKRSVRRHIRKVHKKKIDEIKNHIDSKKENSSRLPGTKGRPRGTTNGRSCPVCHKSFATKANVRRHFDEVHRGLRRDLITPDIATKPGQPLSLDSNISPQKFSSLARRKRSSRAEYNLTTCKCLLCKRKYTSPLMLKRHMRIVHKMIRLEKSTNGASSNSEINQKEQTPGTTEQPAESSNQEVTLPLQNDTKPVGQPLEKKNTPLISKTKVKQENDSPKSSSSISAVSQTKIRKPKLSVGFDFKQLYCKLCKRQFTSKQNLVKHIDLHTDGNDIYIKFYRCPLCSYETRRKRDVIRHITVVHKKSSRYLAKVTANLESRAVKKPIEVVLNTVVKRGPQRDLNAKSDGSSSSPTARKREALETGNEVKLTKNFSLHTCNKCGKAFAKKTYLEHHKKTHRAGASCSPEDGKTKGRSTRSKAFF